ncbi:MAG TPA: 4Fe-4S binding protein [bacterium]|nr:4Fe-4S binding protein [bacterium]
MKGRAIDILARYRIIIFTVAAGVLVAAAWHAVRGGTIFNFHEYCPLSPVCIFFAMPQSGLIWPWGLFFFGVLLITALFLRRAFCGWLCPVGLAQDLLYLPRRLLKAIPARPATAGRRRASFTARVIVLFGTLFIPFVTGSMFFASLCPMIRIGDVIYRTDLVAALLTLGLITILSIIMERFFCRFICPLGLLFGWTGIIGAKLFPTFTITRACKAGDKCGKCGGACPAKIDLCAVTDAINDSECILCLSCVRQCRCYMLEIRK